MLAEVAKLALDELRARRGHEHLTAVAGGSDARGAVDVVSHIALVGQKRRSVCRPTRTCILPGRERIHEGGGGHERSRRGREREEEGVTLRIDLHPALVGAGLADDAAVLGERIGVPLGAEGVQELGRALDVGEEEGDSAGRQVVSHRADHPPDERSRPVAADSGERITGCASVLSLEARNGRMSGGARARSPCDSALLQRVCTGVCIRRAGPGTHGTPDPLT